MIIIICDAYSVDNLKKIDDKTLWIVVKNPHDSVISQFSVFINFRSLLRIPVTSAIKNISFSYSSLLPLRRLYHQENKIFQLRKNFVRSRNTTRRRIINSVPVLGWNFDLFRFVTRCAKQIWLLKKNWTGRKKKKKAHKPR